MTVELLETISMAFYMAGILFTAAAGALFWKLRIPDVVGELSGRKARRGIESIRQQNLKGSGNRYQPRETSRLALPGKLQQQFSVAYEIHFSETSEYID